MYVLQILILITLIIRLEFNSLGTLINVAGKKDKACGKCLLSIEQVFIQIKNL